MNESKVEIRLVGNSEQLEKVLNNMKGQLGNFGKNVENETKAVGNGFNKMFDSIGSSSLASIGSMAGIGLALQKIGAFALNATKEVNELADAFEAVAYETGQGIDTLNKWHLAAAMDGGSITKLEELFVAAQKKINENSKALIANGVAADEAALRALPFEDYLTRVAEIADEMANPMDKAAFLTAALGKTGVKSGEELRSLIENMKEAAEYTGRNGNLITQEHIDRMNQAKKETGELSYAWGQAKTRLADATNSLLSFTKTGLTDYFNTLNQTNLTMELHRRGLIQLQVAADGVTRDYEAMDKAANKFMKTMNELKNIQESPMFMDKTLGGGRTYKDPDENKPKPAKQKEKEKVNYYEEQDQIAALEAWTKEYLAKKTALEKQAAQTKMAFDKQVIDQEKEQLGLALESYKIDLDNKLDLGLINNRQHLEALKKLKAQEYAIEKKSIQDEKKLHDKDSLEYKRLDAKELALEKKHANDMKILNNNIAKDKMSTWFKVADVMKNSMSSALTGMLTGAMSFKQGITGIFKGIADVLIQMAVDIGLEWLKTFIMKKIMAKSTGISEITASAGVAATNAMGSVAAIPVWGWAAAPGVYASTLALGLSSIASVASARNGYDIPSGVNPMTQLHEEEMVIPKELSNRIRNMTDPNKSVNVNFYGVTDKSYWKANEGNIVKTIKQASRNRRIK